MKFLDVILKFVIGASADPDPIHCLLNGLHLPGRQKPVDLDHLQQCFRNRPLPNQIEIRIHCSSPTDICASTLDILSLVPKDCKPSPLLYFVKMLKFQRVAVPVLFFLGKYVNSAGIQHRLQSVKIPADF